MALVLLAGCGSKESEEKEEISSSSPAKEEVVEGEKTDLVDDGVIDFGISVDLPPYEFYEGDQMKGIDVEIADEISKKLGVEVKLHDMDFSTIIASIESGKLDGGISGFTVTEDRKKSVNFSKTYASSMQSVLLKQDSPIKSTDDLEGKKIGTQLGTTGDMIAQEDFGEENVQSFAKFPDAVLSLQGGKLDAIILDEATAIKFAEANDDLKILESPYTQEEYAIAVAKDKDKLLEEINKAIDDLKETGKLQEIVDKYIEK